MIKPLSFQSTLNPVQITNKPATNTLSSTFKELANRFNELPEIGKFNDIVIKVSDVPGNGIVQNAYLILKPLNDKNDFRTRVLSYMAKSPFDETITREIAYISGNKAAMTSALKDRSRISEFKSFITDCEKYFLSNRA